MKEREAAFDPNRDEDQPAAEPVEADKLERGRSGGVDADQNPRQEDEAGEDLDEQIAHAGAVGALGVAPENEKDGAKRQQLPENEERDQIAGEDRAERAPRIEQAGDVLAGVLDVSGEEKGDEGGERKEIAEEQAELVDAKER